MSHEGFSHAENSSLFIPVSACFLGTIVLFSYALSIYQIRTTPQFFDKDAIWGLLFEKNKDPNYCAWFIFLIGETFSVIGFLAATFWLWNEAVSDALGFFYVLFLISEALWMPFAIRGLEYYSATLISMLLAAIAACGLFVCTLEVWGQDNIKGFTLLPLFLHCTFFDLVAWGCSFEPHSIRSRVAIEQMAMFNITEEEENAESEKDLQGNSKSSGV